MMYIRKDSQIYRRSDLGGFELFEASKSNNRAKRYNRTKLSGVARKYRPEFKQYFKNEQV